MNTLDAIYQRRSIRRFKADAVPAELIEKMLEAATKAPSATNTQPWRFVVLEGAKKDAVVEIMSKRLVRLRWFKRLVRGAAPTAALMKRAPVLILVFNGASRRQGLVKIVSSIVDVMNIQSIGGSVQTMLLAAHELGLGTVWLGFVFLAAKGIGKYVGRREQLIAAVAVGYPDESPAPRPRKDWREVTEWLK
jgi:nitroreductase